MKIDQEKFNQLKQMDRIEYRQKKDIIENWSDGSRGLPFLWLSAALVAFTMLLIPQGYSVWGIEFVNDLVNVFKLFLGLSLILAIVGFWIDLALCLVRRNNLKELQEEYFSVEIKK